MFMCGIVCYLSLQSTGEDLGQNVDIARSSEQFSASDAAAINNGNTIVHPVPCHIAPQVCVLYMFALHATMYMLYNGSVVLTLGYMTFKCCYKLSPFCPLGSKIIQYHI